MPKGKREREREREIHSLSHNHNHSERERERERRGRGRERAMATAIATVPLPLGRRSALSPPTLGKDHWARIGEGVISFHGAGSPSLSVFIGGGLGREVPLAILSICIGGGSSRFPWELLCNFHSYVHTIALQFEHYSKIIII